MILDLTDRRNSNHRRSIESIVRSDSNDPTVKTMLKGLMLWHFLLDRMVRAGRNVLQVPPTARCYEP